MAELEIIDHRPRQASGGEPQHFTTILAGGRRGSGFVWGNRAGQETDFIERERLLGQFREMEVPAVDWIEGAAEEADFARGSHGFRSELYRRCET